MSRVSCQNDAAVDEGPRRPHIAVLVVDDLLSYRRAVVSLVDLTEGFRVVGQAGSGEEALAFLEQHPVDLVLMDVTMPGWGGIQAAGRIRDRFPEVRVMLLSIYEAAWMTDAARAVGADFCPKERFGPEQLEDLWPDVGNAGFRDDDS